MLVVPRRAVDRVACDVGRIGCHHLTLARRAVTALALSGHDRAAADLDSWADVVARGAIRECAETETRTRGLEQDPSRHPLGEADQDLLPDFSQTISGNESGA
ncbi:hypothetical protein GCM10009801_07240 [Streptomyces albiaxialis]|uniref:Uncharacterized protein n=1 Tax=Streptomyces albiaxialis TaxID=329523 RepID=A0ABP5H3N7_9ACTN